MSETKSVTITVTHPDLTAMSREDRQALAYREAEAHCQLIGRRLVSDVISNSITINEARQEQSMTIEFEIEVSR